MQPLKQMISDEMKLGIHAYAWCSQWSNATLDLIDRVRNFKMDFIEIPLMRLDSFDSSAVRQRLTDVGLAAVTSTVLSAEDDITSEDPQIRRQGIEYLKKCAQATHEIGSDSFSGVIYSQHVKTIPTQPPQEHWNYAADALREVAEFAAPLGVTIGLEPVNRYETYLINTCEQALELKRLIDHKNVMIHLDSYHMNVEEKSFYEATKLAGKHLIHYHFCENDRGIPGTGNVDWDGIFKALAEINYQGYAALESFVDITNNMNTWVWRKLAPDGDTLLREGSTFLRNKQKEYGLDW